MGKTHDQITEQHAKFIAKQPVFFMASAPHSGRVNVSPRAPGKSCVVTSESSVAIADLSGSGCETAAHVLENGRLTLLFVNLEEGPPSMLRLHGVAKLKLPSEVDAELLARFPTDIVKSTGFRCVYEVDVDRVSTSCGYSMPVMHFDRFRTTLAEHTARQDMDAYRTLKNAFSIDGIPSLEILKDEAKTRGPKPTNGYIYSEPLSAFDFKGRAQAAERHAKLQASPARGAPRCDEPPITKGSAAAPVVFAFSCGVLACLAAQAVLGPAIAF